MTKEQEHTAREYRAALTRLALDLKRARVCASCSRDQIGSAAVDEAESEAELYEERLVSLACTWGPVTYEELNRFYQEAKP